MVRIIEHFTREIAVAARSLRASPVFAITVAVTLAVAIGTNAAILTIMDAVFFRKLPVPAAERIVAVYAGDSLRASRQPVLGSSSFSDYDELRTRVQGLDGLAAYTIDMFPLEDSSGAAGVQTALVSWNYFSVLGIGAERGRMIAPNDEEPAGGQATAVISDALWHSRFGTEQSVIGRDILIGHGHFVVVGVAPPGFTGTHPEGRTDIWMPYTLQAVATGREYTLGSRDARVAAIIGRLSRGATLGAVQLSLNRAAQDFRSSHPQSDGAIVFRADHHETLISIDQARDAFRSFLFVLAMGVLLLLVASSNVASLLLARGASRRHELGVRLCLGATPWQVTVHSLAEVVLLGGVGTIGAIVISRWLTDALTQVQFLSALNPRTDFRVIAIVVAVGIATSLHFGLTPMLATRRLDPILLIRQSGNGRATSTGGTAASAAVAIQVAVSVVLLCNAAAIFRLVQEETTTNAGYNAESVIVASVSMDGAHPGPLAYVPALDEIMMRASKIPGVQSVTAAVGAPLFRNGHSDEVTASGHEYAPNESRSLSSQLVGPHYFSVVGAQLIRGRDFASTDRVTLSGVRDAFDVVIINEAAAKRLWGTTDAIGKTLAFHGSRPSTVIGVIRNMRDVAPTAVVPRAYFPLLEGHYPSFELIARTGGDPARSLPALRSIAQQVSGLRISSIQTLAEVRANALSLPHIAGLTVGGSALIALVLTAVGLYGLVGVWITAQRQEIGIRLAMGSSHRAIYRLVFRRIAAPTAYGCLAGMVVSAGVVLVVRSWLGTSYMLAPWPMLACTVLFACVSVVAACLPAFRMVARGPTNLLRAG